MYLQEDPANTLEAIQAVCMSSYCCGSVWECIQRIWGALNAGLIPMEPQLDNVVVLLKLETRGQHPGFCFAYIYIYMVFSSKDHTVRPHALAICRRV